MALFIVLMTMRSNSDGPVSIEGNYWVRLRFNARRGFQPLVDLLEDLLPVVIEAQLVQLRDNRVPRRIAKISAGDDLAQDVDLVVLKVQQRS